MTVDEALKNLNSAGRQAIRSGLAGGPATPAEQAALADLRQAQADGGDDERWCGEGRCYCMHCGADGDA